MRKKFIVIMIISVMICSSCGGSQVSKQAYESLSAAESSAEVKNSSLAAENSSYAAIRESESLSDDAHKTLAGVSGNRIADAWANSSFGDGVYMHEVYIKTGGPIAFQIIVPSKYTDSQAGDTFTEVKTAVTTLAAANLNYKYINISYMNSDGVPMVTYTLTGDSGKYSLTGTSINIMDWDTITNSLNSATK